MRDPLWSELFLEQPRVIDGEFVLSERPGLGVTLNPEALERYSTKETV